MINLFAQNTYSQEYQIASVMVNPIFGMEMSHLHDVVKPLAKISTVYKNCKKELFEAWCLFFYHSSDCLLLQIFFNRIF